MDTISAAQAAHELDALIQSAIDSHEPVRIAGSHGEAVLLGAGDWRAVQETLHLLSASGVRESIVEGMDAPIESCRDGLDW